MLFTNAAEVIDPSVGSSRAVVVGTLYVFLVEGDDSGVELVDIVNHPVLSTIGIVGNPVQFVIA
jgi:hypothetical protein